MTALLWPDRVELAHRFAPRLVLLPERQELGRPTVEGTAGDYWPRSVELLIDHGHLYPGTIRLLARLDFQKMFDYSKRQPASLEALGASQRASWDQLRLIGPPVPRPKAAWQRYFEILAAAAPDQYPLTAYARVLTRAEAVDGARRARVRDEGKVGQPFYRPDALRDDDVVIQYWFCYYFDEWYNVHEGDWEGVSVFLRREDGSYHALGATYYGHENGVRRHWEDVHTQGGEHPLVFPASGSHAAYFQYLKGGHQTSIAGAFLPGLKLKLRISVASDRYDFVADDQIHPAQTPRVEVLPDPVGPADLNDPAWRHALWLNFPGSWGVRELGKLVAGGPTGPKHKGLKWHNPFAWSEIETWPDYLIY